jgi:hypothetical protein
MHLFFENRIRGGISVVFHQFARANNLYLGPEHYNPNEPHSQICFLETNHLYANAQTQSFPVGGFRFLTAQEIGKINFLEVLDDNEVGYGLECDLFYLKELHEGHNLYPLARETLLITQDLSVSLSIIDTLIVKKLCPIISEKTKCICYYRNLKFYVNMGMKLTKIHRAVLFTQKSWIAPYIQLNTEKRKEAKIDSFVNFWKLVWKDHRTV